MPEPQPNEKESEFVSRCTSFMSKEKPKNSNDQNVAICYSIWREHKKKKKEENVTWVDEINSFYKANREKIGV